MTPLLLALPWFGILAFLVLMVKLPRELPMPDVLHRERAPSVSIIVPARNEAVNIVQCVESLAKSEYPNFEIIVVNDRSEDETSALARAVSVGNASRIEVVEGEELPSDWLGKPWACLQGARKATGDFLLFTDADTTHRPELLARAVAGAQEDSADLMTVLGRQLMKTFWERLVQPQVFMLMIFRFPDFEKAARNDRWGDAIANGQFILMPRRSYDAVGRHEAVKDQVVEDLALAQIVKRKGLALRIRMAADDLDTRMYRSLRELIDGWSKNLFMGGLQSVPAPARPFAAPVFLLTGATLWLAPPLVLVASLTGFGTGSTLAWSATVYVVSACI